MVFSALFFIFCCCSRRNSLPDALNENTTLLAPDDLPPFNESNVSIVDEQDLRDKWTSIVRAKGRKMVNVNAALPFNLHNQPQHDSSASRSRSRSLSTDRRSVRGGYDSMTQSPHAQVGLSKGYGLLAPSPLRAEELPDASTPRQVHPKGGLQNVPTMSEEEGGTNLERPVLSNALGLRLVHPDDGTVRPISSADHVRGRAGRSGAASTDNNNPASRAGGGDDEMPRPSGIDPRVPGLDMRDVGAISVSWGD